MPFKPNLIGRFQPITAKLSALLGTGSSPGLREQLSATTEAIRAIGVTNPTDVPSRAHTDTRFARVVETAPSNSDGANGDFCMRVDGAYAITVYKKVSNAWVKWNPAVFTWAAKPAASAALLGQVITIAEWNREFRCVTYDAGATYRWVPTDGRLVLGCSGQPSTPTAGAGTDVPVTLVTVNSPSGLLMVNCAIYVDALYVFTGSNEVKDMMIRLGGVAAANIQGGAAANTTGKLRKRAWIKQDGANGAVYLANSVAASDTISGQSSALGTGSGDLVDASADLTLAFAGNAGDTGSVAAYLMEVTWPVVSL